MSIEKITNDRSARVHLAKMTIKLFDNWNVKAEDKPLLLGLSSTNKEILTKYRKGYPIGCGRDLLERVNILLEIHKSLKILFPTNKDLSYQWMNTPNRKLEYLTPIEAIKLWGFAGLLTVRSYLEEAKGM